MIFISHRGNISGQCTLENHPDYIRKAIDSGYYVEVDVWKISEGVFLGHNLPQYKVSHDFFMENKLLCHAKNLDAIFFLMERGTHFFWHQDDAYALTSRSVFITHPTSILMSGSIAMLPEMRDRWAPEELKTAFGICSDHIGKYREVYDE